MIQTFIDHFDAMILFDKDSGEVVFKNSEFEAMFKLDIKHIEGLEVIFINYYDGNQSPIFNTIEINNSNYLIKRKLVKNYILYHFEENNYYINVINNIKKQATTDELTGCYNKKEFENIFKRMLSISTRYSGSNFAALMFDLDHFKKVNDTYGHLAGDFILKELSALVHHILRDSDIFARIGGEEFIVLLPQTKLNGALKTAQKIRNTIKDHNFNFNGQTIPITLSAGITSTIQNDTYFSILDRVDKALYQAKGKGRDRVEYL